MSAAAVATASTTTSAMYYYSQQPNNEDGNAVMQQQPRQIYQHSSEYVAIVLSTSVGTRLEPLTSTGAVSKHLLPIVGIPCIVRLLYTLEQSGFIDCIIGIAPDDHATVDVLLKQQQYDGKNKKLFQLYDNNTADTSNAVVSVLQYSRMKITVVRLMDDDDTTVSSNNNEASLGGDVGIKDDDMDVNNVTTAVVNDDNKIEASNQKTNAKSSKKLSGSVEAIRRILISRNRALLSPISHIVVSPGDLVVLDPTSISDFIHSHRCASNNNDIMVLLTDVGEQDEHGIPMKESAKQKKGIGLARNEDDIDYIAIQSTSGGSSERNRIIWKQSKVDVEEDKHMVGATPKLLLPKNRLISSTATTKTTVRLDWNDVHVYIFPPWVQKLIHYRGPHEENNTKMKSNKFKSIQQNIIPLLISRQYKGIVATFGTKLDSSKQQEIQDDVIKLASEQRNEYNNINCSGSILQDNISKHSIDNNNNSITTGSPFKQQEQQSSLSQNHHFVGGEYSVLSHVPVRTSSTLIVRANSVASYLYIHKEMSHQISAASYLATTAANNMATIQRQLQNLFVPFNTSIKSKFHSIIMMTPPSSSDSQGATASTITSIGDKVTYKSAVIGNGCIIGTKCRFNNVILHDNVIVGENTILQNTIVGMNVTIGENCSLNDCQIGPSCTVPSGTKGKGESFSKEEEEALHTTTS